MSSNYKQQLLDQINHSHGIDEKIEAIIRLSEFCLKSNELPEAKKYAGMAQDLAAEHKNYGGLINALNLHGLYYYELSQFDNALTYFKEGIDIAENHKMWDFLSTTLNNQAQIYMSLGDNEQALAMYQKVLKYDPDNYRGINNSAITLTRLNQFDKAIPLYEKALKLTREPDKLRSNIICRINLGELYRKIGQIDQSITQLKLAKSQVSQIEELVLPIHIDLQFADTYITGGQTDHALTYLDEANKQAVEIDNHELKLQCFKLYHNYYFKVGDLQKAYEFACQEIEFREKLFNDEIKVKIASITAMHDVERKELELKQMMEQTSKLVSIGVMAGGITHEINQPLNAISVSANSVLYWNRQNPGTLPELFIEELTQISEGAKRIDEIIRHMRSFWVSDLSSKKVVISLKNAITNSLSLLERQLYAHGILVEEYLETDIDIIEGDPVNLEQVIINLLVNAMHSLDEIDQSDKLIKVRLDRDIKDVILSITDNGKGLPVGKEQEVFDPFFSTKDPSSSMGLGLAIVQNLVQNMNGKIRCSNNQERGACFEIRFPAKSEEL